MQYRCFSIAARGEPAAEEAFNRFLRSVRVLTVERQFVADGQAAYWSFCVAYLDDPRKETRPGKPPRVDYREVLSAADFAVFARLREVRKALAEAEAVPAYAVCTNEQLADEVETAEAFPALGFAEKPDLEEALTAGRPYPLPAFYRTLTKFPLHRAAVQLVPYTVRGVAAR